MANQLDYSQAINQGVSQYFQGRRLGNEERRQMLEEQRMAEAQKRAEEAADYERSTRPLREQALQNQVESQGIDTQQRRETFKNQQGLQRGMTQAWRGAQVPDGTMQPYQDDTGGFAPIEPEYAGGLKKRGMTTDMGRYNKGVEQAYGEFSPQQLPDMQRKFAEAKKEGAVDAMRMAISGDYEQANRVLASTGVRRQDRMSPHPTKKGVAIVSTPEGKHEVNLAQALQAMGAGEKPIEISRGSSLVTGSGKELYRNPYEQGGGSGGGSGGAEGGGMAGMKPDIYTLKDGRPVSGKYLQDVWEASNTVTNEFGQKQMKPNAEPPELWIRKNFGIDITGGGMQQQPQSSPNQQDSLPPAQAHNGRVVRDTATGERYQSNGRTWVRMGGKNDGGQSQFPELSGGLAAPR